MDIDPWFNNPKIQKTKRNFYDGSVVASPAIARHAMYGVLWFSLYASVTSFFLGLMVTIPYWLEPEKVATWKIPFGILGGLGGGVATLWAARICIAGALEMTTRMRTVVTGSKLQPLRYLLIRLLVGVCAIALLIVAAALGLTLLKYVQAADPASESAMALLPIFAIGWMVLLSGFFIMLFFTELKALIRFRRLPAIGPLQYMTMQSGCATIAHWSDLHLTAGDSVPMVKGSIAPGGAINGNGPLKQVIADHKASLEHADVILVTGDITDAGLGEEWRAAFDILSVDWISRIVMVPGNHDLNITNPQEWSAGEGEEQFGRKLRAVRLIAALNKCQGDRTRILNDGGQWQALGDFLQPFEEHLKTFISKPPVRTFEDTSMGLRESTPIADRQLLELPHALIDAIFPCVVDVPGNPLCIIVVDSNIKADNIATNAMGEVQEAHLERLEKIMFALETEDEPYVIAMHHHVALPRSVTESPINRAKAQFMACENAYELATLLVDGPQRVVMHGHRHVKYEGSLGEQVHILSAASTTLGDEWMEEPTPDAITPGFQLVTVTWGHDGVGVEKLRRCRSVFSKLQS